MGLLYPGDRIILRLEFRFCREVEASAKITYQQSVCSQVRAIVIHEEARREAHLEREGCVSPFLRILPATDFFTSFQVFILLFPMSDFYSQDSIRIVYHQYQLEIGSNFLSG